jgi:fructose 1,6-bisphosphate aldolase/phosphatase
MPLMPVKSDSGVSYFDGPPVVSCAAYCVHEGKLTERMDAFDHPFWDTIRNNVALKAVEMRRQGFFGAAMLPMAELEYTGIVEKLKELDARFAIRAGVATPVAA